MSERERKNADLDAQIITLDRQRETAAHLATFTPEVWHGRPIPRRQWCVEGIIPQANVTMLSGDGGLGKTLLAAQLQVAGALALPWLGVQMEPITSLGVYCEDDTPELHRRFSDISTHYGCTFDQLSNVHLTSRVGEDNLLVTFDQHDVATATPLYHEIAEHAADIDAQLVVLDSLHDLFGGNEIMRTHARQFVGLLRRLALRLNGAVLLCAHPSLAGINSGTGTSGSTAWNNAVRSRLYLTKPDDEGEDGERCVVDVVRGRQGPFNPQQITNEYAQLCKEYRISSVVGDAYGREWVTAAWRDAGMQYSNADLPASQLYLEALPLFTRGLVSLPDHPALLRELRLLERIPGRVGKDQVTHPRGVHDDLANAVCGCLRTASAQQLGICAFLSANPAAAADLMRALDRMPPTRTPPPRSGTGGLPFTPMFLPRSY